MNVSSITTVYIAQGWAGITQCCGPSLHRSVYPMLFVEMVHLGTVISIVEH